MDKLKDSLNYIFKEKDWVLKLLLPILLLFIFTVPSLLLTTITDSTTNRNTPPVEDYFESFIYDYSYSYSSQPSLVDGVTILISCLTIFFIVPMIIIQGWYMYENTQSGVFLRKTTAIWKNNFGDTLKKISKYFIVSFVYGFIFLTIFGLIFGAGLCVLLLILALFTSGNYSFDFNSTTALLGSGMFLTLMCLALIMFVILLGFFYLIYTPAILRLIATNTLSESFKFGENWAIGKKHAGEILGIYLVSLIGGALVGGLSGILSFGSIFFVATPAIFVVITLVSNYVTLVIATFFSYFFLPRYMGLVYRDIINSEDSLKFIKLDTRD